MKIPAYYELDLLTYWNSIYLCICHKYNLKWSDYFLINFIIHCCFYMFFFVMTLFFHSYFCLVYAKVLVIYFFMFLLCVFFHMFLVSVQKELLIKNEFFTHFFLKLTISNVESQVQWKNSICIFSLSTPYHRLVLFLSYSIIIFINIFFLVMGLCFRKREWCIKIRTSPIFNAPPSDMNFSLINTTNFF